ncbi:hypothetical protein TIFTF001_003583 [Ficus carica]|uniref:Secreted protein n=1 Tax=Ficus carica TaxID=3494 RepID=A0AA87Z9S0_FICCA|nr:hypothetical protein TIFTF001_003583 [Ficus carica]
MSTKLTYQILMCLMTGLLVLCTNYDGTEARDLGYGMFLGGTAPRCSGLHPQNCRGKPSNRHYARDCEREEHYKLSQP